MRPQMWLWIALVAAGVAAQPQARPAVEAARTRPSSAAPVLAQMSDLQQRRVANLMGKFAAANQSSVDAALEIATSVGAAATPALLTGLTSADGATRYYSLLALHNIKPRPDAVSDAMMRLLDDPVGQIAELATHVARDSSPAARQQAVRSIARYLDTAGSTARGRIGALGTLQELGSAGRSTVPQIVRSLDDPEPGVQKRALYALAHVVAEVTTPAQGSFEIRQGGFTQPYSAVSVSSLSSDVQLTPAELATLPKIIAKTRSPDPGVAAGAYAALRYLGPGAVARHPELVALWAAALRTDDELDIAGDVIASLAGASRTSPQATAALVEAAGRPGRQQARALRFVGEPGAVGIDAKAIDLLDGVLASRNAQIRLEAAGALGRLGEPARKSLPTLARLAAADEEGDVRRAAKRALLRIDPENRDVVADGSAVTYAVEVGDARLLERVLARGAVVAKSPAALPLAAKGAHNEALQILMRAGADPDSRDEDGNTALIHAAAAGSDNIVRLLLDRGATATLQSAAGGALMHAAIGGHVRTVELLKQRGADVNERSANNGVTALIHCSFKGQAEVVAALLRLGADPRLRAKSGHDALAAAQEGKHDHIAAMLRTALGSPSGR